MEETTSPDTAHQEAIERARELLGDEAVDLSDEEIERIRRHADAMAQVLIEVFLAKRTTVH
jgi:hypothetical protein